MPIDPERWTNNTKAAFSAATGHAASSNHPELTAAHLLEPGFELGDAALGREQLVFERKHALDAGQRDTVVGELLDAA